MAEYGQIPLEQVLEPPDPIRVSMDEKKLEELASDIRFQGVLQPIIVVAEMRATGEHLTGPRDGTEEEVLEPTGRFEILAGHRRFLASRMAGLKQIPALIYPTGEVAKEAVMLAENVCREDITAAEEGWLFCQMAEKYQLNEEQLCARVGRRPEYIYARMDLVRKDAELAKLVAERKINFSVANALLKVSDEAHRRYLAQMAADSGCSTRVANMWVEQWKAQQQVTAQSATASPSADTGSRPVEDPFKCFCCGKGGDPQNLRMLYVHWYELETWAKILREAGMEVDMSAVAK